MKECVGNRKKYERNMKKYAINTKKCEENMKGVMQIASLIGISHPTC